MKITKLIATTLITCSLTFLNIINVSATSIITEISPIFTQILEDDEDENTPVIQTPQAVTTPLTPSGNLTLVDDITTENDSEKQFITVISKNGNYFYIIIDRENDKENVYFLNLVDEYDLLQLLGEEFTMPEPELVEVVVEVEKEVVKEEEPEPIVEEKSGSILPLLIFLALAGGGAYYYLNFIKEKDEAPIDNEFDDDDMDENENLDEEEDIDTTDID